MQFFIILKSIFPIILPLVTELDCKVKLPFLVKLKYNALSKSLEAFSKSLIDLRQKYEDAKDDVQENITSEVNEAQLRRKEGINLACNIGRTFANKILSVVEKIEIKD